MKIPMTYMQFLELPKSFQLDYIVQFMAEQVEFMTEEENNKIIKARASEEELYNMDYNEALQGLDKLI